MRVIIQRVQNASVTIDSSVVGEINRGYLILLGVSKTDTEKDACKLADKILNLRIFAVREETDRHLLKQVIPTWLSLCMNI